MKEKEDRGPLDLTLLVEQHAKEKWELTQQLSKAAEELTIFRGTKKLVGDMSVDLVETKKQLKKVGEELRKKRDEGERSDKELDNSLSIALEVNESHQRYNGKLQTRVTELEEDNKKLALQVEDLKLNHVRKAGL